MFKDHEQSQAEYEKYRNIYLELGHCMNAAERELHYKPVDEKLKAEFLNALASSDYAETRDPYNAVELTGFCLGDIYCDDTLLAAFQAAVLAFARIEKRYN